MFKFLSLAFVLMLAFVVVNRERVFVRDPIAKVFVDGTVEPAFQVYINFSNDVLLERGDQRTGYGILVQNWNRTPSTPAELKCIHWMACMTDADHAKALPLDHTGAGAYDPRTMMTATEVDFVDGMGRKVRVTLR